MPMYNLTKGKSPRSSSGVDRYCTPILNEDLRKEILHKKKGRVWADPHLV